MKITGGVAKGIVLQVPSQKGVRPTGMRAREALFSSIGNRIKNALVIDLFAGSGCLGLEAASRGAAYVCFIEKNKKCCSIIKQNIRRVEKAGSNFKSAVICGDFLSTLKIVHTRFSPDLPDFIFADPPYRESMKYFKNFWRLMKENSFTYGTIIWELPNEEEMIRTFRQLTFSYCDNTDENFGETEKINIKILSGKPFLWCHFHKKINFSF